jgi:hypothetical protein
MAMRGVIVRDMVVEDAVRVRVYASSYILFRSILLPHFGHRVLTLSVAVDIALTTVQKMLMLASM